MTRECHRILGAEAVPLTFPEAANTQSHCPGNSYKECKQETFFASLAEVVTTSVCSVTVWYNAMGMLHFYFGRIFFNFSKFTLPECQS